APRSSPVTARSSAASRTGTAVDQAIIEQLASITDSEGFSVLGELLNAFLAAVPVRLAALDRAVTGDDLGAVADQAHALTGSAASFGARNMAALCRQLRTAATEGDTKAVAGLARDVHAEFGEVRAWLVAFRSAA
ncbi:MAG TPA: Hpt domain-containing protein, partial [Actinomycetes bacterium]|nr:Hpt domain-containing protein [Actinomycetes bacterium]